MRLLVLLAASLGLVAAQDPSVAPRDLAHVERAIESRSWAADIWDDFQDHASCAGCQTLLVALKGLALLGDRTLIDILQEICKLSGAEDDDVCEGAIALEGPIIAKAIRNMKIGSKTSKEFCITFLGICEYPDIKKWSVPFPSKKPAAARPASSGKDPIKVVHYSDIHIDPLYVEGSNAECTKPICCRPYTQGDEPGNTRSPAGPNGDHNCDSPVSLEESMYAAIKEIVPDAAFTVFTGDIVDHAVWNTSKPYNEEQITNAYEMMDKNLGIVYGTAGNHEAHPANAFQPNSVGDASQWIYDLLAGLWSGWIGGTAIADTEKLGAYSTLYPHGNLRVISLNTNMYYRDNYWLYQKSMIQDPSGQIAWLVGELDAAEKAGERVYLVGHMPLGDQDCFHDQSNYLDQVVSRYSATIAAMFFGHTHKDSFQISYADYANRKFSNALVTSYIGPSLTPTSGMPSFRVYDVDPVTFGILDATTYVADMANPAFQTTGPVWTKYYSAKEAYGPLLSPPVTAPGAELTAAFWHNVTTLLESDDAAFKNYLARKSRGWKPEGCSGTCKSNEICGLRAARAESNCYEPELGVNFNKRSENRAEERDECGISVARATFAALGVKRDMLDVLQRRYIEERRKVKA
ncbi:Metallo-dependent phosphatase-like protein [Dactylonectria estremocensis]|uniref:Sphingomyelin phosphodiesterase n=1 Tax=Dactylonectria estremocensis TaxID=1079267 RepID=A0A9P9F3X8_9HYPO|nr:Metallo-dependent phosphatase-like protein [Dactylonectria estremocensis]